MGTNFYQEVEKGASCIHLGKRSGAGLFCWNCQQTLCKGGVGAIHYGRSEWYDVCPCCGGSMRKEDFSNSSAGRELGFNKEAGRTLKDRLPHNLNHHRSTTGRVGVQSVASFSWAIHPCNVGDGKITDEYGSDFTKEEFINMILDQCPIQYYSSIGDNFS